MRDIDALYQRSGRPVVTAHRGWSGRYPENTLPAFAHAVELGCDIVEFDVRATADAELVILHDPTVDRTTGGAGPVDRLTLAEVKQLNASYWEGPHDTGRRRESPALPGIAIPTLEETLALLAGRMALNIQVYTGCRAQLARIAALYQRFALHGRAFLLVETFADAAFLRQLDPRIELCVGEDRGTPRRHRDFGLRLIQPWRHMLTPEYVAEIRQLGLWANVFYANTPEEITAVAAAGLHGILSDNPDLLIAKLYGETADFADCTE